MEFSRDILNTLSNKIPKQYSTGSFEQEQNKAKVTKISNKKKVAIKRKIDSLDESNCTWKDHEIDLLIQLITDNFDEYKKGNKMKIFNEMSTNVLKNKEPNAIKINRFTNNENEESLKNESIAISTMSKIRERVWDKKIELERKKIEKNHTIEMYKLEIEKQKWEFEREKAKIEFELKMKEIELKF
ncbi:2345_t:CDS:2, partial [Funneliformis geosporum]